MNGDKTRWLAVLGGGLAAGALVVAAFAGLFLTRGSPAVPPATLAPPPTPSVPESRVIRATPAELFSGDLKRLEPHLNLTTGCVHLEFGLPERFLTVEPEVWQDGKPNRSGSWSQGWGGGPADASVSFTPIAGPGGKPQFRITTALAGPGGKGGMATTRDALKAEEAHGISKTLDGPIDIPAGPPVAVWAYLAYESRGGHFLPDDSRKKSFEEAAASAKWAVMLKVGWKEPSEQ
jgi:hypothetical protein